MNVNFFSSAYAAPNPESPASSTQHAGIASGVELPVYSRAGSGPETRGVLPHPRPDAGSTGDIARHVSQFRSPDGKLVLDVRDQAGKHTRVTWDRAGNCTRDTTDRAGNHIHETWDRAGNCTRDITDRAGNHTHEGWDRAGNYTRERWDKAGDYLCDVWDKRGRPLRHVSYAAGNPAIPEPMWGGAHKHSAGTGHKGMPGSTAGADSPAPDGADDATAGDGDSSAPDGADGATAADGDSAPDGDAADMWTPGATGGADADAPDGAEGGDGSDSSQPANGFQTGNPTGSPAPAMGDGGAVGAAGPAQPAGWLDHNSAETSHHSSAIEPALEGFSAAQQGILRSAWQHAKLMVDSTLDKLVTHGPDANFERWFGPPTPANVEHVKQVLSNIQHALAHDQYILTANPGAESHELARVNPGSTRQILMAPLVFDQGYGQNTVETTMVHELTHFMNIAGTRDHAYGLANDHRLAAADSQAALDNADNYARFVGSNNPAA